MSTQIKLFIAFVIFNISSLSGYALPLVSESAAVRTDSTDPVTLYPDHEDPNKFYYFPNTSTLGKNQNGLPKFTLVTYNLSNSNSAAKRGGYLSFISRLQPSTEMKASVDNFLKKNPKAGVAVLPVKSSKLSIRNDDNTPMLDELFSSQSFSKLAGRAEDDLGANLQLTEIGAYALTTAFTQGQIGNGFNMYYCYQYEGLGPNMDAKIHVKMHKVYEHFTTSINGRYWWWRSAISHEVEKLRKNNDIEIERNGGDATDDEYIREVTNQIIARMFKENLANTKASSSTWNDSLFSFSGGSVTREELNTETWILKKRDLVLREHCLPIDFSSLQCFESELVKNKDF